MFSLHSKSTAASGQEGKFDTELAWNSLYRQHQMPLVSFACRRGCDEHEAWDVVQELFLRMFRRGGMAKISALTEDRQRGWLMHSLRLIICNRYRDRKRVKRGSSQTQESLDVLLDQGLEIASSGTPATEHDRRWAMAVLERGMMKLRADMKPDAWAGVESTLWGQGAPSTPAMRVATHRARLRLREIILREGTQASLYHATRGQCL